MDQQSAPGTGPDADGHAQLDTRLHTRLGELRRVVADARSMPMSASAVVNRAEVLALIDEITGALRSALAASARVAAERDLVVEEGREEARRIVAGAQLERDRLVGDADVHRLASQEAARLLEQARSEAEALRLETDDYVDAKLANFEITLERTSEAVKRGRARLAGRSDFSGITADEADRIVMPEHLDG
jgi:cell division septum initiation protein DivIVA